jgi:putative copper resistance protein D
MPELSLISVRFALYIVLASLFGLSAFSLYGLRTGERSKALALRFWLGSSAVIGLLLSTVWLDIMASSMAGTPPWPIDQEAIGGLLTGSAIGAAWKVRMIALAIAAVAAMAAAGRSAGLAIVMAASAVALATLAWTGHGAMDENASGWVHLAADILHLIASGAWLGALFGLVLLVSRPAARVDAAHLSMTHRALHGFGAIGTLVVATIVVTGLYNGWMLIGIGNVSTLPSTLYGQLFILKMVLFIAMLGLAWLNRFRLTPTFERAIIAHDANAALSALRSSLAIETACIITIFALVAWLGTLEPPATSM